MQPLPSQNFKAKRKSTPNGYKPAGEKVTPELTRSLRIYRGSTKWFKRRSEQQLRRLRRSKRVP